MSASERLGHHDDELVVEYSKTGGIAGFHTVLKLSEFDGTLSAEDAKALGRLLDEADFFNLPGSTELPKPIPDAITYVLTVHRGRRRHSVVVQDASGTGTLDKLGAVFAWLEQRSQSPIDPHHDAELAVDFKKSGGIGGFHSELTLSESDGSLSSDDATALGALLDEAEFFSLPDVIEAGEPISDGFAYVVGASCGRRHHTVRAEDGTGLDALPTLRALIAWLDDRAPSSFPRID